MYMKIISQPQGAAPFALSTERPENGQEDKADQSRQKEGGQPFEAFQRPQLLERYEQLLLLRGQLLRIQADKFAALLYLIDIVRSGSPRSIRSFRALFSSGEQAPTRRMPCCHNREYSSSRAFTASPPSPAAGRCPGASS